MTEPSFIDALGTVVERYAANARAELDARWAEWPLDLSRTHIHEVIAGLLARQVSLAVQIASAPSIWNPHAAPVLLRAMTELIITLAWILEKPDDRAKMYIHYGLGQMKLDLERRKSQLDLDNPDPAQQRVIEMSEAWIEQQRWPFLTEVNLGSWSEISVRKMAQDTGLEDLYNYPYQMFSAAAHSMWHHVERLNLQPCHSPLHRYHRVPADPDVSPDFSFLDLAAKYLAEAFAIFDNKLNVNVNTPSAYELLSADIDELLKRDNHGSAPPAEA